MPRIDASFYRDPGLAGFRPPGGWSRMYALPLVAPRSGHGGFSESRFGRNGFRGLGAASDWISEGGSWAKCVSGELDNYKKLVTAAQILSDPKLSAMVAGVQSFYEGNVAIGPNLAKSLHDAAKIVPIQYRNALDYVANGIEGMIDGLMTGKVQPPTGGGGQTGGKPRSGGSDADLLLAQRKQQELNTMLALGAAGVLAFIIYKRRKS